MSNKSILRNDVGVITPHSTMEADTISKHGRSSKSQMSRRNELKIFFIIVISILLFASKSEAQDFDIVGHTQNKELVAYSISLDKNVIYYQPPRGKSTLFKIIEKKAYINHLSDEKTVVFVINDFYDNSISRIFTIRNFLNNIIICDITDPTTETENMQIINPKDFNDKPLKFSKLYKTVKKTK